MTAARPYVPSAAELARLILALAAAALVAAAYLAPAPAGAAFLGT